MARRTSLGMLVWFASTCWVSPIARADDGVKSFIQQHCADCHDADQKKGNLDLSAVGSELSRPDTFAEWVKVLDRVESGEMPPKKKPRPPAEQTAAFTRRLHDSLIAA